MRSQNMILKRISENASKEITEIKSFITEIKESVTDLEEQCIKRHKVEKDTICSELKDSMMETQSNAYGGGHMQTAATGYTTNI